MEKMQGSVGEILTIVIPALNEEGAIGDTISRCLDAREQIKEAAGLADVEVIVVSDGSTDRTAEIAQGFKEIKVVVLEKNHGYGFAICEGWRRGQGTLLGFLDADGTCDPECFAAMCRTALEDSADVVLGSRLGPNSEMPLIRKLGNRFYALLLGLLCGRKVTDAASGMRVVRRRSLKYLFPLPSGLHFTPCMSARALLNDLRVVEIPIPYKQRVGTSKLSVVQDGIRFLRTIMGGVLCFRPEKFFLSSFVACLLMMVLLASYPIEFYLQNRYLEEWMIYRFVVCFLLGSWALLLLLATSLTNQMAQLGPRRSAASTFWPSFITTLFGGPVLAIILLSLVGLAGFFLWPGIVEYTTTRHTTLHWSRLLAGAFALFAALQTAVFTVLFKVVSTWVHQRNYNERNEPQVHPFDSRPSAETR